MDAIVLFANKLELRYYFNDKSNYMDALIRNKCEKELLTLVRFVAELLDVKMMIYSEPFLKEGGFSELWGIAGRNSRAHSIVLSLVMHLLTRPTVSLDGEALSVLSAEEEKKMEEEIASLRARLKEKKATAIIPHEMIAQLNTLPRVRRCKSIFFEAVKNYPKVTRIAVREVNESNRLRSGSLEVKREQFAQFICKTIDLSDESLLQRKLDFEKRQLKLDLFDE